MRPAVVPQCDTTHGLGGLGSLGVAVVYAAAPLTFDGAGVLDLLGILELAPVISISSLISVRIRSGQCFRRLKRLGSHITRGAKVIVLRVSQVRLLLRTCRLFARASVVQL